MGSELVTLGQEPPFSAPTTLGLCHNSPEIGFRELLHVELFICEWGQVDISDRGEHVPCSVGGSKQGHCLMMGSGGRGPMTLPFPLPQGLAALQHLRMGLGKAKCWTAYPTMHQGFSMGQGELCTSS